MCVEISPPIPSSATFPRVNSHKAMNGIKATATRARHDNLK